MAVVGIPQPELPRLNPLRALPPTWRTTGGVRLRSIRIFSPRSLRSKARLVVMILLGWIRRSSG